jgi:class 3 adenylate cyclase/tetratricopeptide (TPR) repeat protein
MECGTPLARACPSCGTPNAAAAKFCGECGTALTDTLAAPAGTSQPPSAVSASERRLVSVLFADLVGFTTLSESRDAEEVRDLLTRYFEACRRLIATYGGTIEKFIGDAVMAVWGAPTATEDDAERAVRAALELTRAVSELGEETGAPDLRARAGVLTGEAAVNLRAEGQGMVAGDLVNTAARIQAAAPPGAVFVGEATKRATEAAVVYEAAGTHELKGKAEPVALWHAVRVVAGARGALKSTGLEAPFVGRERELRTVKELFFACGEDKKAHLVSVVGIAGIGKSRLAWEFYKYFDGLPQITWYHRGRCLAYGEGVAYWALAEMVRMRARIAENEDAATAATKLHATVEEHISDPEERRWIEPRLAHLIGLEEHAASDREDLFAAWRRLFERLAEKDPVAMVFEDMQWADAALLEFIEYLLEWSRNLPIFVLTLSRPELIDRQPNWGAGRRNFTSLYLEPLSQQAMELLMDGLVPGLPDDLKRRILSRAEGVPLYAMETVRMLLDRGLLVQEGAAYRPTGPIEALDVPETLHALIAARLDGLSADERAVVQDASVLGKTFFKEALAAVSGREQAEVDAVLASLVRKEILSIQADERSPDRGQYSFLQDLLRKVAYDTLSRKDRKTRHLAAAEWVERTATDSDEVVEVVASHLHEAYKLAPEAPDAPEIRERAIATLTRAGERAESLAATREAEHYYVRAIELGEDRLTQARLSERAGQMAWLIGHAERALEFFDRARDLFGGEGHDHEAARVSARASEVYWSNGDIDRAVTQLDEAFAVMATQEPDEDLAVVAGQLGRFLALSSRFEEAAPRLELALRLAGQLRLPEVLSHALSSRAIILQQESRLTESRILLEGALAVALENDLSAAAFRAYNNLEVNMESEDQLAEVVETNQRSLALARRMGAKNTELSLVAGTIGTLVALGRWDEALADSEEAERLAAEMHSEWSRLGTMEIASVHAARGDHDAAHRMLDSFASMESSVDSARWGSYALATASVALIEGRPREAADAALRAYQVKADLGPTVALVKGAWMLANEAAMEIGDHGTADRLLAEAAALRPGERTPLLRAGMSRFDARLRAARGEVEGVEDGFKQAAGLFREIETTPWLAATLVEHAEWLIGQGRAPETEPLLSEARSIFDVLQDQRWLARLARLAPKVAAGDART